MLPNALHAIRVTPTGRFPIVSGGHHPLRAAVDDWRERGNTSPESALQDAAIMAAQKLAARELLAAQEAAGVDLPSDGYVPVYDEWFAWAPSVAGVRLENAIRYLDTNTYYHRWHITERPRRLRPGPHVAAFRLGSTLSRRPLKPCLFGPYTLWTYALREGAGDSPAAFDALADVWAAEVADLAAAGAQYVQLEEAVLLRPKHRDDVGLVARAVQRIAEAAPSVQLILHFACGAVGDLLEPLLDLPIAGIGLDLTDAYRAPNLVALAHWRGDTLLQAGVANAREIRVETARDMQATLQVVMKHVPAERCLATPSTALLYLPRHAAFEKLGVLAHTAHGMTV